MSAQAEVPRFGPNRYGPAMGSEFYEDTRRDFVPMNPPVDGWQLAPFLVPMPHEVNLPQVPVEMEWVEGAEVDPERKQEIEDFVRKFYRRAAVQEVVGDIERVDVYEFVEPEHEQRGYKVAEYRHNLVEPVVSSGMQFENNFERNIFFQRINVAFGDIRDYPRSLNAWPSMLETSETPQVRATQFRIPATHLGTVRAQQGQQAA